MDTIETISCPKCKSVVNDNDFFCGTCGFPIKGTPEEQKQFSIKKSLEKYESDNIVAKIQQARIILFVISGLTIIFGIVQYFKQNSIDLLVTNLVLGLIYAGLGIWAKSKPFAATLSALLLYVGIILLNAFIEPSTIYQGIIIKILFIGALIKASYGSYKFKIKSV